MAEQINGEDGGRPLLSGRQRAAASASPPSNAFDFAKGSSKPSHPPPATDEYRRHRVATLLLLVLCALVLLFRYDAVAIWLFDHEDDVETKDGAPGRLWRPWGTAGGGGRMSSSAPTPSMLLERLAAARSELDALLRADYGEYAGAAFNRSTVLGAFPAPGNMSSVRLKRRLKIKVIEAALKGISASGGGSGGSGGGSDGNVNKASNGEGVDHDESDGRVTFRWITAGHSASAGHGNMLNQTYTASVQAAASLFFDAVGIDFIAKSRAAGGTNSGPDGSMCMEAMYGADIDVLWWDFGMTDGHDDWLHYLWGNRVAIHPSSPIMLNFDDSARGRQPIREEMERNGLATFTLNQLQSLRTIFPDSKNNPNVDILPRAVAYYMCGGHHENDDVCGAHKWDTAKYCPKGTRFQTSWHNGWKDHLFIGRLAAVFLFEYLSDALKELGMVSAVTLRRRIEEDEDAIAPSISKEYLNHLRSLEKADLTTFAQSPVSTGSRDMGDKSKNGFALFEEEVFRKFLRKKSFCRPADLPSQARYLGLATGGKKRGVHLGLGVYADFDEGHDFKHLPVPKPNDDGTAPLLTRFEGAGNRDNPCYGGGVNIDFKDVFLVRNDDKWTRDIIPNGAELQAYEGSQDADVDREGIVMICTRRCDWGKCTMGHVGLEEVGNITILIDEEEVKSVKKINDRCYVMVNKNGSTRFGPGGKSGRKKGQYEVKYRVNKKGGNLLMSVIVIV